MILKVRLAASLAWLAAGSAAAQAPRKPEAPWTVTTIDLGQSGAPVPHPGKPALGLDFSLSPTTIAGNERLTVIAPRRSLRTPNDRPDTGGDFPWLLDASTPIDNLFRAGGHCDSAYRTIGGQPGTGADMIGGPGGGRC